MEWPKVSIVTPIHNGWSATSRYLRSVAELDYPEVEVIIVDDGSTDGSAALIQQDFPQTVIVSGDGTLWWSGASNKGALVAIERGARFIFTCNNDVILDPDVISSSVACARDAGNALVGAMIFYQEDPNQLWFSGARFDRSLGDIVHETELWPENRGPKPAEMLTGMGMLIPARIFTDLDGFDRAMFPHYLADCDFSLRAAAHGCQLLVAPTSKVYNDVSSAWSAREVTRGRFSFLFQMLFSMRSAYWIRGRIRFYRRHWGPGWIGALFRLYRGWFSVYGVAVIKEKVKSILRWNGK